MAALLRAKYVQINSVKGSLKSHEKWWLDNVSNAYVLDIIKEGYQLPLSGIPPQSCLKNNKSAREHPIFVSTEIEKLVQSGIVQKLEKIPTVVNPLTVAESAAGKLRLVLDVRTVNPLINVPHCKFEDLKVASNYFTKGCFMITFDLKSGYHHVDIHPAYHQYLGFAWENVYYTYVSLPFGVSSAGIVFTKILKELVKRWRSQSIPCVVYLDDGLIIAKSYILAER